MRKNQLIPQLSMLIFLLLVAACSSAEESTEVTDSGAAETADQSADTTDAEEDAIGEAVEEEFAAEAAPVDEGDISATSGEDDNGVPLPTPDTGAKVEPERIEVDEALADAGSAAPDRADDFSPDTPTANSALTAGEVDDNAQWDAYLAYLDGYSGAQIIPVDVRERHQIWVQDSQERPILGAKINLVAGGLEQPLLSTQSDGRALFFPRSLSQPAEMYSLNISYNGQSSTLTIPANAPQRDWVVTLPTTALNPQPIPLDILFLVDATGSMSDEINQLKENIFTISTQINALPSQPFVRFGMVTYRDRGDAFITQTTDFTADINQFATSLNQVSAAGGGDYPEDLNSALSTAVHDVNWRSGVAVRLIFLIGDAPPHLDYGQQNHYAVEMLSAAGQGIKIYPIASSGLDSQGEYIYRQMAQTTGAHFIFLTYGSAGPGSSGTETEFDVTDYTVAALDALVVRIVEEELRPLSR